ncbi:MAG TPA: macro domain-containing protein [Thermoanaerobaculia bacterium]|nr:macro domain-containing protein [Thermoanaerobaculia bacterium]
MPATIELAQGDITAMNVDAIVNAANEQLQLGSGVAGAIRRRGGPSIQDECNQIGGCPVGGAIVTSGGDLPAKWVIHTVGPIWRGGGESEEMLLTLAVRAAFKRAEEIGARSVALPAISAGVYGFPLRRAAELSIGAARSFAAEAVSVQRIVFCLYDDAAMAAFERAFGEG